MKEAERKFAKAVEATAAEFGSVRTGRASPHLLERLSVSYYGTMTPLNQIATVSAQEARLLVIQPYDRTAIAEIEKAITQSDLGFVPSDDGHVIRVPIPQLTEERRKELGKLVKTRAEEGRVAVRNVRRDAIEALRKEEKKGGATEDDLHRGIDEMQKFTDKHIKEIDELTEKKIKELMEI
ncbi:MAG: ribosome recycling factor [Candidatus Anoxymicrobium japonicum]|uniref:Ribosome-recycling factor n=1 Tax=Candidatus Anoxymicrobium japonicum TaxID=2013648 RepID=A0A2N3G822_9ACTN|nr:MAG: ribosome recycling factor [Candidatus Anoxymicrobium japonicum]